MRPPSLSGPTRHTLTLCNIHRKAFVIDKYIQPEELPTRLVEWEDPKAGQDEIVVDVHYAGLNCASTSPLCGRRRADPAPTKCSLRQCVSPCPALLHLLPIYAL